MQWKYQKEAHNRQAKTLKANYREDFAALSQWKASAEHLALFKENIQRSKEISDLHNAFKCAIVLRYYNGVFCFAGNRLNTNWRYKQYAQNNSDHSNRTFRQHIKAASHDVEEIIEALQESQPFWTSDDSGSKRLSIRFCARIHCDTIVPYQTDDKIRAPILFTTIANYVI